MPEPMHLGDGAYVKEGEYPGEVVLYTSNGVYEADHVVLDPSAVRELVAWLGRRQSDQNSKREAEQGRSRGHGREHPDWNWG